MRVICAFLSIVALSVLQETHAADAEDDGPDVRIIAGDSRTIYEYWQNGHLRRVMIVPATGKPYYLRPADPTRGNGELDQSGMLVPSWVLVEF